MAVVDSCSLPDDGRDAPSPTTAEVERAEVTKMLRVVSSEERVTAIESGTEREPAGPEVPGAPLTREQRRSRRKRAVRARTISVRRLNKRDFEREGVWAGVLALRPQTRAECREGPRPCPFVSCRYHLYLDVSRRTGSIKLNFPDLEVWEMPVSCALDVAEDGGATLEDVGAIMNVTRERIRQLEVTALERLALVRDMKHLREFMG
jgi:hypothetical protein